MTETSKFKLQNSEKLQPSNFKENPNRAVSRRGQLKFFTHGPGSGVFPSFFAMILHDLGQRVEQISPGFLDGFTFGEDFRQFFKVAGVIAFRGRFKNDRQGELQVINFHELNVPQPGSLLKGQSAGEAK